MAFIKKAYMKAKKKAFGAKGFRGRYDPTRAGVKSLTNLAKDIKMIQSRLNVEKKFKNFDLQTGRVGQVNGNVAGFNCLDVTPSIEAGVANAQRIGDSLKFTGASFPIQFSSLTNTKNARKLRVMMFKVLNPNDNVTNEELVNDYFDANPLTNIRDFQSPRAYRTGKQDGIKLIRSQTYYLKSPPEGHDSEAIDFGEQSVTSIKFNVKLNDVIRYGNSGFNLPDGTQYFIAIFCDAGNASNTTTSTLDVPVKVTNSGVDIRMSARWWYVDN